MTSTPWETSERFIFGELPFRLVLKDFNAERTSATSIAIIKNRRMLAAYSNFVREHHVKTIVEFGIFEGGSPLLLSQIDPGIKVVGIDIRPPNPAVLDHIRANNLNDRVRLYYNTSQDDREAVERILRAEFGREPAVDLIIDDASHQYKLSSDTFRISFDALRQNTGWYFLEDWGWAHWSGPYQSTQWTDMPALTNLVVELMMLYQSRPDIIAEIGITRDIAMFRKGDKAVGPNFNYQKWYLDRGRFSASL